MITNPYKILGVPDGASEEECTAAYKKLAKRYHPDLNPDDPSAAEKMAEINAAYDQIKSGNPYGRTAYGAGTSYEYYRQKRSSAGASPDYYTSAAQFINNRQYSQALNVLNSIEDKTAQWYYLSAMANIGLGNRQQALSHIQQACAMDPDNFTYQNAYVRINNAVRSGGYSTFGGYTEYNDRPHRRTYTYSPRQRTGCSGRLFRFVLIILIIRFIFFFFSFLFDLGNRESTLFKDDSPSYGSSDQYRQENDAQWFFGMDGENFFNF